MSNSYLGYRGRSDDVQDHHERHVWNEQKYIDAGSIIKVEGTDSQDEEAAVMVVGGVSFNLKKQSDSEVILFASSSDTNLKMALLTIPRDKQRRWPEDEGGIQHPIDADFALHFSKKIAHLTKAKFGVGEKGQFEVKDDKVYVRGDLVVSGEVTANKLVRTPNGVTGTQPIPGFEGNKQAQKSQDGGGGGGASTTEATQLELDFSGQMAFFFHAT